MSPTPDPTLAETLLRQAYARARQCAGPGPGLVALHIGAEQSGIAVGHGPEAGLLTLLPLGAERTARAQFRRTPPTPLDMENAIQVVEDAVMPLHRLVPPGALLFSCDAELREIAQLAGVLPGAAPDAPMPLTLEDMERCFNRLVKVVEGSPAAQQGLPASNAFAARLLILREFMHHLRFDPLQLLYGR